MNNVATIISSFFKSCMLKNYTFTKFLFTGFGGGSASLVSPLYSTEISETSIRGILGSFFAFGVASGTLFDNSLGSFMHWYDLTIVISLLPGKYDTFLMNKCDLSITFISFSDNVSTTLYDARLSSFPIVKEQRKKSKEVIAMVQGDQI